jgi:hypothetical protein
MKLVEHGRRFSLRGPDFQGVKMPIEEQAASAYELAADGCRRLVRVTSDNARTVCRVKPDEESHVLSELDFEEGATWDDLVLTTPERVRRNDRIGIQPLAPFVQPIEKDYVAAT